MSRFVPCDCGEPKVREARMCRRCYGLSQRLFRYPYKPLGDMLGGNQQYQASRLGVEHYTIRQLIRRGLSPFQADRYAVAAGVHPCVLWPSWFDDALADDVEDVA